MTENKYRLKIIPPPTQWSLIFYAQNHSGNSKIGTDKLNCMKNNFLRPETSQWRLLRFGLGFRPGVEYNQKTKENLVINKACSKQISSLGDWAAIHQSLAEFFIWNLPIEDSSRCLKCPDIRKCLVEMGCCMSLLGGLLPWNGIIFWTLEMTTYNRQTARQTGTHTHSVFF